MKGSGLNEKIHSPQHLASSSTSVALRMEAPETLLLNSKPPDAVEEIAMQVDVVKSGVVDGLCEPVQQATQLTTHN